MNNAQVNHIIAKFEYGEDIWLEDGLIEANYIGPHFEIAKKPYTESLDSLIPVWEKLNSDQHINIEISTDTMNFFDVKFFDSDMKYIVDDEYDSTIQQAASHGTAKAILELTNRTTPVLGNEK